MVRLKAEEKQANHAQLKRHRDLCWVALKF
jgi:hypothetical protein